MNTPHRHAEVLRAIADGKEVQFLDENKWTDYKGNSPSPLNDAFDYEWRVKPEPKPDVVKYLTVSKVMGLTNQDLSSNAVAIFCGETGRLKSLELI